MLASSHVSIHKYTAATFCGEWRSIPLVSSTFLVFPKFEVNSVIRETIGFLFEEITGNFTTLVTNYLVSFYQNTTSLSMTEICGYLCMIETAYISLHKNLSFSDIWGNVLKPCIINGLNDSSFHLPVYECLRVIRAWHRLISSEELIEVNSFLIMCLKCGSIGVRTIISMFNIRFNFKLLNASIPLFHLTHGNKIT